MNCSSSFAATVEHVAVIEEADPILEEHVKSLGNPCCTAKTSCRVPANSVPLKLRQVRAKLLGESFAAPQPAETASDLPDASRFCARDVRTGNFLCVDEIRRDRDGGYRVLQPRSVFRRSAHGHQPLHGRRIFDVARHGPRRARNARLVESSGTRPSSTRASPDCSTSSTTAGIRR